MSRILDSVYTPDTSLGPQYDEKLRLTLTNVWRHKTLVLATVAAALLFGFALTLMMPKEYTAEAYMRGGFAPEEAVVTDAKSGGWGDVTVDALVETRSRLLQSQQMARRVVERLGLEKIRPAVGNATGMPEYQKDIAAKKLLRGLSVITEPRVYLVVIRYTARDPELAALITNAFVAEFLQSVTLQIVSQQRDSAERTLSDQLATLGAKHPKAMEAKMRLEAANAQLKAQLSKTTEDIERTADGSVTFARAVTVPSGPQPSFLMGIALLVGLAGGIGIAAFLGPSRNLDQ